MDETRVLDQILAHDRAALAQFYRTYAPKLRRFIAVRIQKPEDGEEILQDTLYGFLEGLRDFHGKSKIYTYLVSICQHKIVDFYRKKKIKQVVFSQLPHLESFVSPLLEPEVVYDTKIAQEKIERALAHMKPLYRRILMLKYLDQASVRDIAHKLSMSIKSVESRLFRARKSFVDLFLSI